MQVYIFILFSLFNYNFFMSTSSNESRYSEESWRNISRIELKHKSREERKQASARSGSGVSNQQERELSVDDNDNVGEDRVRANSMKVGLFGLVAGFIIGATVTNFVKSESNKLRDLRKERNSLKKQLKTAEKVDKPKLETKINDLNAQIEKKETEIKSLKSTNAITKKKLAEAEDKEGILKAIEIFPKRYRTPVRTKVKAFFKQMGAFGTKAVKPSKNQYNNVMKLFTRKHSPSKGKSKPKTAANKSKTSTAMTAKNKNH